MDKWNFKQGKWRSFTNCLWILW